MIHCLFIKGVAQAVSNIHSVRSVDEPAMATKEVKLLTLQLKRIPDSQRYSFVRDSFDSIPHRRQSVHYSDYCRQIDSYNDDLSNACRRGDKGAVEQIIAQSNAVTDEQLQRLIEVSAAENQVEIIKHVLHRIRNRGETQNRFNSAAFIAAYRGKQEGLSSLLNLGMVSNSVVDTESVNSLLHIAAAQNEVTIIEEVYKRNTSLAKKLNKAGIAPLHVAVANGHQEVTECLLEHTPCSPAMIVSAKGNTALHSACQYNQEAIAEYLITQSTPDFLTSRNEKGFLPIHFAATQGNAKLVKMLSEYMERLGVSGNSKAGGGWTPLHCATEAGHVEVAKYYCSQRTFKPESCTKNNFLSPLHSAAISGKRLVLEYLLRSGKFRPDMPSQDFGRSNSLHLAAYHGHIGCCQLLIDDYNLLPTDTAGNNFTAIHLVAASGNLAIAKYFVEIKGCSPAVCNSDKATPLHMAAYYGKAEMVSWLLSTGKCDPNSSIPVLKVTPLHLAASEEHLACVKALSAHKACNPNAKDMIGMTPLLSASSDAICWELIKAGATPPFKMKLSFVILAQTNIPEFFEQMKKYRFLRSWSAILPSVRLFVVGASEAGKSTLVKALQKEDNWIKGRFVPVDGVEMHTSGVKIL